MLFQEDWLTHIRRLNIQILHTYSTLRTSFSQNSSFSQRCSVKKMFLEISQNLQEKTCARDSVLRPATLLKKRLWYRCFLVNFAKRLRTPFLTEHLFLQNTSGGCFCHKPTSRSFSFARHLNFWYERNKFKRKEEKNLWDDKYLMLNYKLWQSINSRQIKKLSGN